MRLPPELSPWSDLLQLFSRDIALSVGGLIKNLYAAIGPMKQKALFGESELYGFQGIHNRGQINHLLPSEWLLAEELPDEFDRRAAMGEQLFFYPQRIEPKQSLISSVLFDSGISQLGGPRIVHLALLILLARRAWAGKADFYWGVLQAPSSGWQTQVDQNTIECNLLNSRTVHRLTESDIEKWQSRLTRLGKVTDRWIIGGEAIAKAERLGTPLHISELPDPQRNILSIRILKSAEAASFQVELPPDNISAQILRNPFGHSITQAKKGVFQFDPSHDIQFSHHKRRIIVGTAKGVAAYPVPGSPADKIGKPRFFKGFADEQIVAFEVIKKGVCAVTYKESHLLFHRFPMLMPSQPLKVSVLNENFQIPPSHQSSNRLFLFPGQAKTVAYLLDSPNKLFRIQFTHPFAKEPVCEGIGILDQNIAAVQAAGHTLVYAAYDELKTGVRLHYGDDRTITAVKLADGASGRTFLGISGWNENTVGLAAINTQNDLWQLMRDTHSYLLAPPPGSVVVGVLDLPVPGMVVSHEGHENYDQPSLVLLEDNNRQVTLLNRKGLHKLFRLPDPISKIEVEQNNRLIGVIDSNGVLKVFSLKHMNFIMELLPGTS